MRPILAALAAVLCLGAAPAPEAVALKALLSPTPAPTLSTYRLFTDEGVRQPNAGVTPYGLNTPLFSDYAEKQRYLYLPPGTHAAYRANGALSLPVGATLIKTFAYPADVRRPGDKVRMIETRLLIHRRSGWVALAYVWNDEQTEAVLKRAGKRIAVSFTDAKGQVRQVDYRVPNANQCKECHSLSGRIAPIGVKARNLNGDYAYAEGPENQLAHWRAWACSAARRRPRRRRARPPGTIPPSRWRPARAPTSTATAAIATMPAAWPPTPAYS
jgi:uncharacterized repeat protein (TIGR03806 family)